MILVTGGAGYIGSVLIGHLLKDNHKVRIIDTFWFGKDPISSYKDKIEVVKGDIRNPPRGLFKDIKTVIHLAGFSNDPTSNFDPYTNFEINTKATISFAKLAKKSGVSKFIFGSSCSIYDQGMKQKILTLTEQDKVNPVSGYSLSKFIAEQNLLSMSSCSFCVVILRKGTVYGYSNRMRYDLVVNTMIKDSISLGKLNVLAGGKQYRPLISVDDVARGYSLMIRAPFKKVNGNIFNLLSKNYQIINVAKLVKKSLFTVRKVKIDVSPVLVETRNYKVSNSKIAKTLDFKPQDKLPDVVIKTVENIKRFKKDDFDNFNYYNIQWMKRAYEKQKKL